MGALSAIASVGSSVIGGMMGKSAAKKAGKAQARANTAAIGQIKSGLNEVSANTDQSFNLFRNFMDRGSAGFNILSDLLTGRRPIGDFEALSPGYNFRMSEGMEALEAKQRMSGLSLSGNAVKEFEDYGQGVASSEFNNYIAQLMGLAGFGFNAAGAQANVLGNENSAIMSGANSIAGITSGTGTSNANSIMAGNTAMVNGITGGVNNLLAMQNNQKMLEMMGQMFKTA